MSKFANTKFRENDTLWVRVKVSKYSPKKEGFVNVKFDDGGLDIDKEDIIRMIPFLHIGDEVVHCVSGDVWTVKTVIDDKAWCVRGMIDKIMDVAEIVRCE